MQLSKLKLFKVKSLASRIAIPMLLLAISGCSWFGKSPKLVNNYCEMHYPLKKSEAIRKDLSLISNDTYEYIKVNESTYICDCLHSEKREQCRKEFLALDEE